MLLWLFMLFYDLCAPGTFHKRTLSIGGSDSLINYQAVKTVNMSLKRITECFIWV